MHDDSPGGFRKDRRFDGDADHRNSAKAGNGLSPAKAAVPGVRAAPDRPGAAERPPRQPNRTVPRRVPRLELSLTQILGSTGAAVTAAFLGSRLGVAGTLIGAALASVISVVGGALYTTSLKATRQRVTKALVGRAEDDGDTAGARPGLPLLPTGPTAPSVPSAAGHGAGGTRGGAAPGGSARRPRPGLRGAIAGVLVSAAVFVGALLVVTGVESVTGSALSGGSSGGLTILGGSDAGGHDTPPGAPASSTTSTSTSTSTSTTVASSTAGAAPASGTNTASSTGASTTAASTTAGSRPPTSGAVTPTATASPSTGTSPTDGLGGAPAPTGTPTPTGSTPIPTGTTAATGAPTATAPGGDPPATSTPASTTTGDASVSGSPRTTASSASSTAAPTSAVPRPPR